MELYGIFSGSSGNSITVTFTNCCSAGNLEKKSGTNYNASGLIGGSGQTYRNSYYLDGIAGTTGITARTGDKIFYKTSNDPEAMTTAKVVDALNGYIINPQNGENTTGWCKWKIGKDNLPELDLNTEWNGTTWVTANS